MCQKQGGESEANKTIQAGDDYGLGQGSSKWGGKKYSDSRHILNVDLTVFTDGWRYERESKMTPSVQG